MSFRGFGYIRETGKRGQGTNSVFDKIPSLCILVPCRAKFASNTSEPSTPFPRNSFPTPFPYTPRGEQRGLWGDSVQPLLYEYNEYGERVAMRTFQTLPNGDPSHEEDKGAKTSWQYDEATGALLKKEYADGNGPTYKYTEAGQLKERHWAREISPQSAQRATEEEGDSVRRVDIAALRLPFGQPLAGYLRFATVPVRREAHQSDSVDPKQNSQKANSSERTFKIATSYSYDALTAQLLRTESAAATRPSASPKVSTSSTMVGTHRRGVRSPWPSTTKWTTRGTPTTRPCIVLARQTQNLPRPLAPRLGSR